MDLSDFFKENPVCALAFSGGADSAFLLYAACRYGKKIRAYYVKTAFQPEFEQRNAVRLAEQLGADLVILPAEVLSCPAIAANGPERCYHCKKLLMGTVRKAAEADGYPVLLDGTNASDRADDRPGMRALRELSVRSPLRELGYTKNRVRAESRKAGLFTWDLPAYASLATRIPTGTPITQELLSRTEAAEEYLTGLGFRDFRVRTAGNSAKIQVTAEDAPRLAACRRKIVKNFRQLYDAVLLDMEYRNEQ